jgi:hypothetical protein
MSRPQKLHKPLKFNFSEIINAVADGKGVKQSPSAEKMTRSKNLMKAINHPPKK